MYYSGFFNNVFLILYIDFCHLDKRVVIQGVEMQLTDNAVHTEVSPLGLQTDDEIDL